MTHKELIDFTKAEEGFREEPYKDHLGHLTIGYGFKLDTNGEMPEDILKKLNEILKTKIPKDVGEEILKIYLDINKEHLSYMQSIFNELPEEKQNIIIAMSYQLGVDGVLKFKNMWEALKKKDYLKASKEMIDSKWFEQTPKRAEKLALKMRNTG